MNPDPIERIHQTIVQNVIDIGAVVDGVANRMKALLGDAIGAVFEPLAGALQGVLGLVSELVAGLLGDLATPEDLVKATIESWLTAWGAEGQDLRGRLTGWLEQSFADIGVRALNFLPSGDSPVQQAVATAEPNPLDPATIAAELDAMPGPIKGFLRLATGFLALMGYAQALQASGLSLYQQASFHEAPVQPLSPAELASAVVQSQVGLEFAQGHARRSGLTPELFDIMVATAGEPPGADTMLELWRRGTVDEETVTQAIRESRLKPKYTEAVKALRFVLPSPSDLIRFLVRDAFDDTVAADLGTDTDFDAKYSPAIFDQVGLSKDLAQRHWRAHWQLPSPTQLFEMHHRTTDAPSFQSEPVSLPSGAVVHRIISQEFLQRTLQINDLLPPFLDKYRLISFNPIGRIDARRMFLADTFTEDDLFRAYLDEGYSQADAARMVAWQAKAKADAQLKEKQQHAAPLASAIREMYRDGLIDAGQASSQLVEIGETQDKVDLFLAIEDLTRERRKADAIRAGVKRLYSSGFVTEEEARTRLASEGYTPAEADRLISDWNVDIEFREHTDEEKQARELTKANILDAYRERAIGRDEATSMLLSLKHAANVVEFWLEDVDRDEARANNKLLQEAIHADYVDEVIDRPTASAQLDGLGLPAENREALLRKWAVERRRKEPNLTPGQVESGYKARVIDEDTARGMLARLRYSADEIDLLVQVWGQEMSIAQERLDLSRQQFAFRQEQAETTRADRLALEQRRTERETAAEARKAQAQLDREQRTAAAEQARHDRNLADAVAREQRANEQREVARQFTAGLQEQRLQAQDVRQQRGFDQQIKLAQQREAATQARFEAAQAARIAAEERRTQAQIEREGRQEQARIRAESRAQQAKIATENRGERRQLEKELRAQEVAQAREDRAQQARVEMEKRTAQRASVLAQATAEAQARIQQLQDAEAQRLSASSQLRTDQLQAAMQRRIAALQ